jgi:4-hydroxyphenylpyruvate dioxygenase-like putative hemolysin
MRSSPLSLHSAGELIRAQRSSTKRKAGRSLPHGALARTHKCRKRAKALKNNDRPQLIPHSHNLVCSGTREKYASASLALIKVIGASLIADDASEAGIYHRKSCWHKRSSQQGMTSIDHT